MIRLSRNGTQGADAQADVEALRDRFRRQHCVHIPQLLDVSLLAYVQGQLDRSTFTEICEVDRDTGRPWSAELALMAGPAINLLYLLVNDPCFLSLVQAVTECGTIGCFKGRIYRVLPGHDHYHVWHDDRGYHHMIGMSINLSAGAYAGGLFQLRRIQSSEFTELPNPNPGDAILFQISESLEHQVTPVTGGHAKTAFAGWFCSQPDFKEILRGR